MIVAGTGHRPKYCPCKYKDPHPWLSELKRDLRESISEAKTIITGMALGWDIWLAQVALQHKIPIHCYIPFKGQEFSWPKSSRKEYQRIIGLAEKVVYISEQYYKECFLERDRAMIDNCNKVYSLLNPEVDSGGTYYTVQYAKSKNLEIKNFWRD
jgi:uncharacterized phage-like protein YoqJ